MVMCLRRRKKASGVYIEVHISVLRRCSHLSRVVFGTRRLKEEIPDEEMRFSPRKADYPFCFIRRFSSAIFAMFLTLAVSILQPC